MGKTHIEQVKVALSFEEQLNATLLRVTREHGKSNFTFKHNETGDLWRTTLSKLINYGHNKFRKLNKPLGLPKETKGELVSKIRYNQKTLEEILLEFTNIHGDRYNYSKVAYINSHTKVELICEAHGSFWQSPANHKSGKGCPQCSGNIKKNLNQALNEFTEVHADKYDYSDVVYINSKTKVKITCSNHGSFWQRPADHKLGAGCPSCAKEYDGWSYTAWKSRGKTSKSFDSFKVYIIRCFNEEEVFLKIGRTFHTVESRFKGNKKLPYSYEVVKVFEGNPREMAELEVELQNLNKEYRYVPNIGFRGQFECFSQLKEETFAYNKE